MRALEMYYRILRRHGYDVGTAYLIARDAIWHRVTLAESMRAMGFPAL